MENNETGKPSEAQEMIAEGSYPECEKVIQLGPLAQAIGGFFGFLNREGIILAKKKRVGKHAGQREVYLPANINMEDFLYRYFGIDRKKVNEERAKLRAAQAAKAEEVSNEDSAG